MAGVHAFDSDEKLSVLLEFVRVSENDFSKRGATAGVVHNVLHDSLDVTVREGALNVLDTPFFAKTACVRKLLTLSAQRSPRF